VIGSQYGGGFLLGGGRVGGTPHQYAWHRGNTAGTGSGSGTGAAEVLIGSAALECVRNADWVLNGQPVKAYGAGAAHLSGAWDIVSTRIRDSYATAPTADGFAFDGRILDGGSFLGRCGNQWLGEVIIYNRRLTDEEDAANRAYLAAKWGFAQAGLATSVSVSLAAGTTLDCGGVAQALRGVSGAGAVVNGTLAVDALVADAAAAACPTIETLALADGFTVELRNLVDVPEMGCEIKIANVGALASSVNLRSAVVVGDIPEGYRVRVCHHDGALYLKIAPVGLVMVIR